MNRKLDEVRHGIMDTLGRITSFWGFSKIMGQLYGMLYLSATPMTLDQMAEKLEISKGNVSINIRALERWNMVRPVWVKGDRKDYYEAETDFWKIIRGVLKEREKKEFDQALAAIGRIRKNAEEARKKGKDVDTAFTVDRLKKLEDFIKTMDQLVGIMLTLEDLKQNFLGIVKRK